MTTARRQRSASQVAAGVINKATLLCAAYSRICRLTAVSSQSEPSVAPWRWETLNRSSATGDQLENEHDCRDDQQQMDQATSNVADQS
jgi:hypothetical protein